MTYLYSSKHYILINASNEDKLACRQVQWQSVTRSTVFGPVHVAFLLLYGKLIVIRAKASLGCVRGVLVRVVRKAHKGAGHRPDYCSVLGVNKENAS